MKINGMETGMMGHDPTPKINADNRRAADEVKRDILRFAAQVYAIQPDEKKRKYIEGRGLEIALQHVGDQPEYWLFRDMFSDGWNAWHS